MGRIILLVIDKPVPDGMMALLRTDATLGKSADEIIIVNDPVTMPDNLPQLEELKLTVGGMDMDKMLVPSCWTPTKPKYKKKNWKPDLWRK
jgi:hypothetical protein